MSAVLHHGDPLMIDYTPTAAVTAGDMILIGTKLCVAHLDIAADELGSLAYPGGNAVYRITLLADDAFTVGDPVTITPATGLTNGAAGTPFGTCVGADVDEATGDVTVAAVHDFQTPGV